MNKNKKGFTLIEVLVAVGISAILIAMFVQTMYLQNTQINYLQQKMASSDLSQQLIRNFSDPNYCSLILASPASPITFEAPGGVLSAASPANIAFTFAAIPVGTAPGSPSLVSAGQNISSLSSHLTAAATNPFNLANIIGSYDTASSIGTFVGDFQVLLNSTASTTPLKPSSASITVKTTSANGHTQKIVSCSSTSSVATNKQAGGRAGFNACGNNTCCQHYVFPTPFTTIQSVVISPVMQDWGHNSSSISAGVGSFDVNGFDVCLDHNGQTIDNSGQITWMAFGT